MLTREHVVEWVADRCGPTHAEQRVVEGPAAFLVHLDSGGPSPIVVRRRTGEFWHIAEDAQVHTAKNDRRLRRAIRKVVPFSSGPAGVIPGVSGAAAVPEPGLTRDQLGAWLRATRGWRHIDSRIADLGWAFAVSTQPDAFHDGDQHAMTYGNGPMIVAKRTGEVWSLSSSPELLPAFNARDEYEFHRILAKALPGASSPTERVIG